MRAKPKVMLFLAAALAVVNVTAQTNSWELSQPGAKVLMGVDVKSLRESAVGQSIREQMNQIPPSVNGIQSPLQGPMQAMALGFLDQVDRVFVSSVGAASSVFAASSKNKAPFLLVVEGRFPMLELQPFLKGTPKRYRDADVYRMTPTDVTTFAFVQGEGDKSTLLLGDEKSVLAALDRRGGALLPASALLKRGQALAAVHDFWIIADRPLAASQPAGAAASNPMAAQLAAQVKGIDMGLSLHDGFQFELGVAAESEPVAAQLTQLLSTQIQMALLTQGARPETAEMAKKLHISAEGNRIQLSLALTKDEFIEQLRTAQAARLQAGTSPSPVGPQPQVRPAKTASPGHITIYGLDDGPRVIQTTH